MFGATERTGQLLLERAVERGHEVVAFVRDVTGLSSTLRNDGRVSIVEGDAYTSEGVERAYEEQLEADGDDGSQASLAGERALASIERVGDDLQEKVDQFEEREDAPCERFQEAMR